VFRCLAQYKLFSLKKEKYQRNCLNDEKCQLNDHSKDKFWSNEELLSLKFMLALLSIFLSDNQVLNKTVEVF